ncbi:chaperone modulator CbpM [Facilibium subflavum]|uniref:chaperone modulator CbpM n=1 Tax=Facilibium subflavum TaxID=2219058 RepID=UPI000E657587|nr:chaperone modulator CbpM [Facilibium subflavum]
MQDFQFHLLSEDDYLSIEQLSTLLCVPEQLIIEWVEHDVVYAKYEQKTYYIRCDQIDKAKSALRLAGDLGVNASGISIILTLREKIRKLEAMLDQTKTPR